MKICRVDDTVEWNKFERKSKENQRKNKHNLICIGTANATTWQRHACMKIIYLF